VSVNVSVVSVPFVDCIAVCFVQSRANVTAIDCLDASGPALPRKGYKAHEGSVVTMGTRDGTVTFCGELDTCCRFIQLRKLIAERN
jgi:hypothetical protein